MNKNILRIPYFIQLKPTYFKQKYYIILVEGFERLIIKFTEFHAICKID